jgi:hypothetical protein
LLLRDVPVGLADGVEHGFQGRVEELRVQCFAHRSDERIDRLEQSRVGFGPSGLARQLAPAVPLDQRQRPLRQVAQAVRQFAVQPVDQGFAREVAVVAERHLPQQEVAQRVQAEFLDQRQGVDGVAEGFGHLLPLDGPPAVREYPPRRRDPRGLEEGRPVDRVEADDVLADEMHVRRPEPPTLGGLVRVAGRGDVVRQRIQPHVHHVRRVARHRNAPSEGGAADREVLESGPHEAHHLVPAGSAAR